MLSVSIAAIAATGPVIFPYRYAVKFGAYNFSVQLLPRIHRDIFYRRITRLEFIHIHIKVLMINQIDKISLYNILEFPAAKRLTIFISCRYLDNIIMAVSRGVGAFTKRAEVFFLA